MPLCRHPRLRDVFAYARGRAVRLFREDDTGAEQVDGALARMMGHSRAMSGIAITPDEQFLVSMRSDRTLMVWELKNHAHVRTVETGHTDFINCVSVSPDGLRMVTGSDDHTLKVFVFASGECVMTLTGHGEDVWSCEYSSDGLFIVSGSYDGTVKVWNAQTGVCTITLTGHSHVICSVVWSPDNSQVLSGSADNTLKLWDRESENCLMTLTGHSKGVRSVDFSPNGLNVLSGSNDNTIKHWDIQSGKCVVTFTGHSNFVLCVKYSPNGTNVLSGSRDNTVKLWCVLSGECERTFVGHTGGIYSLAFTRNGLTVYTGSFDKTIHVWSCAKGTHIETHSVEHAPKSIEFSLDGQTLHIHCEPDTFDWSVTDTLELHDPNTFHRSAFKSALGRGSVESLSMKVLFMGATMAGKTALLAALQGHSLPGKEARSIATRFQRMRLVFNKEGGFFEAVPVEEYRLKSMIGEKKVVLVEEDGGGGGGGGDGDGESETTGSMSSGPSAVIASAHPVPTTSSSTTTPMTPSPATPIATTASASALTMSAVQGLLKGELSEQHIDLDTFDFAGEAMFDSLPALFMGSESAYILVFDLSVMNDATQARRQYEHLSKWAHLIAHQVPETLSSYFRVLIVGTHLDTLPDDTAPSSLLRTVSDEIDRVVGPVLGNHLILPGSGRTPFFQVGSAKGIGLRDLSKGMRAAVRGRRLPLEYVCAQDLVGRWSRKGRIELLSSVADLPRIVLSETTPVITVGSLVPDEHALRTGLVPYLEEAADVLVCRENSSARGVSASDTIVFDVPRLIAAVELLCSVVMAQWKRATSDRALDMLDLVKAAGRRLDNKKTLKLFAELDEARQFSEEGFPVDVALWLVWTAAAREAKGEPLLAGADVPDGPSLFSALERLSLVFQHNTRLLVPMLLPDHAPFVEKATTAPVQVMLYQVVKDEEDTRSVLPVSLATFHLVVVALWRETMKVCAIRATQRCTDKLVMGGCAPVRLRLNVGEDFIRVEVFDDGGPPERVVATLHRVSTGVCDQTRSLRWGWRGASVLVPASPMKPSLPLFRPLDVAASPEVYREEGTLAAVLHSKEPRVCNEKLEEWWTKRAGLTMSRRYVHAAALIVGVSCYESTTNAHLAAFPDLPGVRRSVSALESLWKGRGFSVQSVTDTSAGDQVTAFEIGAATRRLVRDVGEGVGRDALLIVHLLGHGAEDSQGGLLLSDAERTEFAPNIFSPFSRFNLDALKGLLTATVQWPGCNILVVCDFCWSGALLKPEHDLAFGSPVAQHGYSRQLLASSLGDTSSYMSHEQVPWTKPDGKVVMVSKYTRLTELLLRALEPATLEAFRDGEEHITAVGLRQRLREMDTANTYQAMVVGRMWDEWLGTRNDGDILLFRDGK